MMKNKTEALGGIVALWLTSLKKISDILRCAREKRNASQGVEKVESSKSGHSSSTNDVGRRGVKREGRRGLWRVGDEGVPLAQLQGRRCSMLRKLSDDAGSARGKPLDTL
eukprot:gb/GEZJ01002747.1/.p2 GENE.gb/GEZJ01002747.1/~~gb/GEZJ01002747.1/.p2  ORF type:complete len:110 (+),score=17.70 gb/GEZJ01002747.1/:593-922(+)